MGGARGFRPFRRFVSDGALWLDRSRTPIGGPRFEFGQLRYLRYPFSHRMNAIPLAPWSGSTVDRATTPSNRSLVKTGRRPTGIGSTMHRATDVERCHKLKCLSITIVLRRRPGGPPSMSRFDSATFGAPERATGRGPTAPAYHGLRRPPRAQAVLSLVRERHAHPALRTAGSGFNSPGSIRQDLCDEGSGSV